MTRSQTFIAVLLSIQVILGFTALTTMAVDYLIITNTDLYPPFFLELLGFFIFYLCLFFFILYLIPTRLEQKE